MAIEFVENKPKWQQIAYHIKLGSYIKMDKRFHGGATYYKLMTSDHKIVKEITKRSFNLLVKHRRIMQCRDTGFWIKNPIWKKVRKDKKIVKVKIKELNLFPMSNDIYLLYEDKKISPIEEQLEKKTFWLEHVRKGCKLFKIDVRDNTVTHALHESELVRIKKTGRIETINHIVLEPYFSFIPAINAVNALRKYQNAIKIEYEKHAKLQKEV